MNSSLFAVFILASLLPTTVFSITCLNLQSAEVDYFFLLKYPKKTQCTSGEKHKYAYYDSSMSAKDFTLRSDYIDASGEALYATLSQINQDSSLQVIAWNDEPANGESPGDEHTAHSKGVIVYDAHQKNGIYIVHSIPKYPSFGSDGSVNPQIPTAERKFGQNVLCMSLDANNLDEVASGLEIIGSIIYQNTFSESSLSNLYSFSKGGSPKSKSEKLHVDFSVNRQKFQAFYKNPYYESGFIFEDIMVPVLNNNLYVESWGRPYQSPSCSGSYQVLNVQSLKIQDDILGWADEDDHSKWAITDKDSTVCSGDMNRMTSQDKRGGAFFCFKDSGLWNALNGAIVSSDSCSRSFLSI